MVVSSGKDKPDEMRVKKREVVKMKGKLVKVILCFLVVIQFVTYPTVGLSVHASGSLEKNFLSCVNVTVDSDIMGEIETPGSTDYYKFTTTYAGIYTVGTTGFTDTYGALYDKDYNLIKDNDDSDPGSNNFSITHKLKANQTYYVAVGNYLDYGTGAYILRITMSDIIVQMYNEDTGDKVSSISPAFRIFNFANKPISLSNLKIRYYFTADSEGGQEFKCSAASFGESNVTGKFVKTALASGSDNYLEIGFGNDAGEIDSGDCIEFKTSIVNTGDSLYTQIGDYSFNPSADDFACWYNVTAYVSGVQKWGKEPVRISEKTYQLYDSVDAGNIDNEKLHNLNASGSGIELSENLTVRNINGVKGSGFSYDLSVPAGTDSVELIVRETYSKHLTRDYNIYLDDVLLKHYTQTSNHSVVYTIKATGLKAYTKDGKLRIKFEDDNTDKNYGPSISDIWVYPVI